MRSRIVKIHIDHLANPDGDVWAVRFGRTYFTATEVHISVPMVTVFKGIDAPQPKAYFRGVGVVRMKGTIAEVTHE